MEKKSLGRGLEDISRVFLSKGGEKRHDEASAGFSSVRIRKQTCESCKHFVDHLSEQPKCKIFSIENEKYHVPPLETVTSGYGHYCRHFEGTSVEETDKTVSNNKFENGGKAPELSELEPEVEETVRVERKIAFPNIEDVQGHIRKALFEHIEKGYEIKRMDLRKAEKKSEPGRRQTREVEITIFIRADSDS